MSTNSLKSSQSKMCLKSTPNSNMFEPDDDDDVSDGSSNKEEDYEDESFEEEGQEEESSSIEGLTLSTLEHLSESHRIKTAYPNKTFSPSKIREIERQNAILMNKILHYSGKPSRPKVASLPNTYHVTSAAINRKKNQMKIDWENQILLRKIQSVKPSIRYRN